MDLEASGRGTIVCRDGFRVGRLTAADFRSLGSSVGLAPAIIEVDRSSLFCEFAKSGPLTSPAV